MKETFTFHISNFSNPAETLRKSREYFGNVDHSKTEQNIVLISKTKKEVATKLLGSFIKTHDEKQKREARKYKTVDNFLEKQFLINRRKAKNWKGKGDRDCAQLIVQIGQAGDNLDRNKLAQVLRDFGDKVVQTLGNRVVAASVHMDETSPHLQIDYLPIFKDKRGGYRVGNSGMFKQITKIKNSREAFKVFRTASTNEMKNTLRKNYPEIEIAKSQNLRIEELKKKIQKLEEQGYDVGRPKKTIEKTIERTR
ncbi:plasmid recombination protein [Liquorilactobacillus sicerae]|uniref:plasmid recombination protein n=1 Tax=Liquorilactobacillus sicerae TaxID=1416943 RepID=UPI002480EC72|nr:plasmid recombination protein [Liquorilactobacillus sicerae]